MTVTTRPIVERIDVVGHVVQRELAGPVDVLLDPLLLQAARIPRGCAANAAEAEAWSLALGARTSMGR